MALRKLLGVDTLVTKDKKEVDVKTLEGKVVLLYFSAHWCPPCRQFTPILAKLHSTLKAQGKEFEIVFISSDHSQEEFDEYFKSHPWLALPYQLRKQKEKIQRKVKVSSLPTLAIIDKLGRVASTNARAAVMQDQEGKDFPWLPKNPWEILKGAKYVSADDGDKCTATTDELKKCDSIGLYFSAHWCPPCRAFTPRLTSVYRKLKAKSTNFEVVFVSLDESEEDFSEYLSEMPWLALPFGDNRIRDLADTLKVEGIPTLITVKPDGTIINSGAKDVADEDEDAQLYPWAPVSLPPVTQLNPGGNVVNALNNDTCVVLSVNGAANASTALSEFKAAVSRCTAEVNAALEPEDRVRFFTVDDADDSQVSLYKKVLSALGLGLPKHGEPTVLMMNLPNSRASRFVPGELSEAAICDAVKAFKKVQDE